MFIYDGSPIYCNDCGSQMEVIDETMAICPNCSNNAYLDEEDPDEPGRPMQTVGPYSYDELF